MIKYVTTSWTLRVGKKDYPPSKPNKPVFVEGLNKETAARWLKEGKIAEFEMPDAPKKEPKVEGA